MIEMGHGAGANGGNIIAYGNLEEIKTNKDSQIAPFLNNTENVIIRDKSNDIFSEGSIDIKTSKIHNVCEMNIQIPN